MASVLSSIERDCFPAHMPLKARVHRYGWAQLLASCSCLTPWVAKSLSGAWPAVGILLALLVGIASKQTWLERPGTPLTEARG